MEHFVEFCSSFYTLETKEEGYIKSFDHRLGDGGKQTGENSKVV